VLGWMELVFFWAVRLLFFGVGEVVEKFFGQVAVVFLFFDSQSLNGDLFPLQWLVRWVITLK